MTEKEIQFIKNVMYLYHHIPEKDRQSLREEILKWAAEADQERSESHEK